MSVDVRRVQRADGAELIAANCDDIAYHAPWVTAFTDQPGFDAWFARGVINLNEIVFGVFRSAYLGYWGYAATGGRGLMTDALRAAVRYAFDELGLHRVEANVQPDNVRSIALVRRAGFVKEGFSPGYLFIDGAWRDHERWALRAGEPSRR